MAYPTAAGSVVSPAYSGTFIPEIWSPKILDKFYAASVLPAISNTDYEGEIKSQGDKVIIRTRPTINISKHSIGQALVHQRPTSGVIELLIDQGLSWDTIADDVTTIQSDIKQMNLWSEDAGEQLKIALDREILGVLAPLTAVANRGATAGALYGNINLGAAGAPLALTKVNIIDHLVDLNEVLTQQDIPEPDRFFVIPAWAASLIKKSDLKDASMTGDGISVMRNGRLGMIDNCTIYSSNLLSNVTDSSTIANCTNIFAGNKRGLTFASQLLRTETLRVESTYGDVLRGLHVYGFKVV